MDAVETVGTALEFACESWPRLALLALFTSPCWLSMGLQLVKHWSVS